MRIWILFKSAIRFRWTCAALMTLDISFFSLIIKELHGRHDGQENDDTHICADVVNNLLDSSSQQQQPHDPSLASSPHCKLSVLKGTR